HGGRHDLVAADVPGPHGSRATDRDRRGASRRPAARRPAARPGRDRHTHDAPRKWIARCGERHEGTSATRGQVRVGLAGLGSMGRNHLRVLSNQPGCRLVAVADPVTAALDAATASGTAQGFEEPLAMIEEADLDALVIAAPTTTHTSLALAAIERGIP